MDWRLWESCGAKLPVVREREVTAVQERCVCSRHGSSRTRSDDVQPSASEPVSQISSLNSSLSQFSQAALTTNLGPEKFLSSKNQQKKLVIKQEDIRDEDFQRLEVLGDGSYSVVVAARHLPSRQVVALKELSRRQLRDLKLEQQLQWEINVHRTLRHPNVVRMLSYYVTPQNVVLVLEMCPRGTLLQKLRAMPGGKFDEKRAARYLRQVARALLYLHQHGIVHRDLKLENILLDARGVARLGDFGWSKAVASPAEGRHVSTDAGKCDHDNDKSPTHECNSEKGRLTVCGTLDYLSPEMLSSMPHSYKTDVWSLGAMLVEMLCGVPPFYRASQQETLVAIREAAPLLGDGTQMTPLARDLVLAMLQKNPDCRPSMEEVMQHPWTRDHPGGGGGVGGGEELKGDVRRGAPGGDAS